MLLDNSFPLQHYLIKLLIPLYRFYLFISFALIRLFIEIYLRFRKASHPHKVRSVLHVSCLSHKPFMLSRLMREKGLKSEYLAVAAETGWLQVGTRGYDYNVTFNTYLKIIFQPWIIAYYILSVMGRYDVIHYHFATLLTNNELELALLKRMGKVIVFHFRGCDLRQRSVNNKTNPELNCCQECDYPEGSCENRVQSFRISLAKKYADLLFVTTPDLLDFLPEAEQMPFIAPYGIDLGKVEATPKNKGVFRVVTSSNHDSVDGTEYIRKAVKRLQEEGRAIELIEVHKTPYEKALSIYKSADVYVSKLRMGYYNNANIECMMMAIPCMSYVREEFLRNMPDCPIIITRPDTVYQRLKEYIDQPEKLKEIGQQGIQFVKKYHDSDKIVQYMIKRYNEALTSFS